MANQAAVDIIRDHHVETTGLETDPVTGQTVAMIERFEGDVLHTYHDMVGVPTIGYGHTGPEVTEGLHIDQSQADALLHADLAKFEQGVDDLLADNAVTSDNQFGAMVSLAYNIGLGALARSRIIKFHNAGAYPHAADDFLSYCHAGGHVVAALLTRRKAERALYLTPDPRTPGAAK